MAKRDRGKKKSARVNAQHIKKDTEMMIKRLKNEEVVKRVSYRKYD